VRSFQLKYFAPSVSISGMSIGRLPPSARAIRDFGKIRACG
jgi:hypothetical protein